MIEFHLLEGPVCGYTTDRYVKIEIERKTKNVQLIVGFKPMTS